METIDILNHYRIPLVSSADYIQILARLLRDGPQTASDLSTNMSYETKKTNRLLNVLYRAGFIEQRGPESWVTSTLGETILDGLQLTDIAADDLAQGFAVTPSDKFFIRLWMERPTHVKDSRTCLSLLRSLEQVQKLQRRDSYDLTNNQATLLYAIFITADRWAHETGVENAAEVIRKSLHTRMLSSGSESEKEVNADSVAAEWETAMRAYLDSNLLLLYMPDEPPRSTSTVTVQLTWVRALDAALSGTADQGFIASCYNWDQDQADGFWRFIFKHEAFEQPTRRLFEKWTGIHEASVETLHSELTHRLLKVISKPEQTRTYANSEPIAPTNFQALVTMLEHASEIIKQDGIDIIPKQTRSRLGSALTSLQTALSVEADNLITEPSDD